MTAEPFRSASWAGPLARRLALILLLAAALVPLGCAENHAHRKVWGDYEVSVFVDEKLNREGPLPVDLVVVYDKALVEKLLALPASEWFVKRTQFRRDNEEGKKFDLWGWEWVPGQAVPVQMLPRKRGAIASIVFADYQTPGEHRWRVEPNRNMRLELLESEILVTPVR